MIPAIPVDNITAVVDYVDEHERSDFRETPADLPPYHIYRHVLDLRRWLSRFRRAFRRPRSPITSALARPLDGLKGYRLCRRPMTADP